MMTRYRRKPADATMIATALGAGAAVGAAVFYLAKLWLQREPLDGDPEGAGQRETSDLETSEGPESSR
jgi:hypothetical protein